MSTISDTAEKSKAQSDPERGEGRMSISLQSNPGTQTNEAKIGDTVVSY